MTSREIQDLLVDQMISILEQSNYQYAAARLLLYGVYKDVYGGFEKITLKEMIKKNIILVYDSAILDMYTDDEFAKLDSYIPHKRDENFITQVPQR